MSKKIISVVGARPQFIKAAALSHCIQTDFSNKISEVIVHTGQHYDDSMSQVFFEELGIPKPKYNLGVGSGMHGEQTASMLSGLENVFISEKPDCIIIYGDTNSTVAAALAAGKLHIPVAHIEAGMRSFDKTMPEEMNRVLSDHISTYLFCASTDAMHNLQKEGFDINLAPPYSVNKPGVFLSGDIMLDAAMLFSQKNKSITDELLEKINDKEFILLSIHRDFNTDNVQRLSNIFTALNTIQEQYKLKIIFPIHPRTKKALLNISEINTKNIITIPPVSYEKMTTLLRKARMVITDSGGLQKESYFFQKPCVVLRPNTEWIELVENGNNILADADPQKITEAFNKLFYKTDFTFPEFYGDGKASKFILNNLLAQ
nr:UDP-N-acetylglucosamine 2-epimerase (non-hydrolyzing) [Bacteroidota bacterium]